MPSLSEMRKKRKGKEADETPAKSDDDDESKQSSEGGEEEDPEKGKKKGGLFGRLGKSSTAKNDTKGKEKSKDGDEADTISTPSGKGMFGGAKSLFGSSKKKKEEEDTPPEEEGKGGDSEDDADEDDAEDSGEEEPDENDDNANKPGDKKNKKTKGKKKKEKMKTDTDDAVAETATLQNVGFIRKQPKEKLEKRLRERVRVVAENMPEVHFLGEVVGGVGFGPGVSCRWTIEYGKYWELLSGEYSGQSQYGYSDSDDMTSWNHPIDLHMTTSSMQGWPRIRLQVWELDEYGRTNLAGYGFAHMPTNAGSYEFAVPCWRPTGSLPEEISSFFLGTNPQLTNEEVLFAKAWENRCRLVTIPSGKIWINMSCIHRFFADQNVDPAKNTGGSL